ncbi:MAG: YidC/Oxa1 family membrane protein insertase [Candidatus Magasanikbacteria bacterium]|jgi:YidC/Oxa1 family membrane protein insertase
MFSQIFNAALYQPIFNIFVALYNFIPGHDVGLVIIAMTVLIRVLVYPLTNAAIKAQKSLQELQPKMDEIKKQYAGDQQKQSQALMELYKNNKVNPFASCLPLIIQLPILIALYMVLRDGLASHNLTEQLYSFVASPGVINPISFGHFNMLKANWTLAVMAGAAQYWQARMTVSQRPPANAGTGSKDESMMAMMNKQMTYMMPAMTVLIGLSLPSGLTLYWFVSTVLMGAQQVWLFRKNKPSSKNIIEGEVVK